MRHKGLIAGIVVALATLAAFACYRRYVRLF
jgi:hypothetical protein